MPFDYSQENYTQLLWAFEGGTSYYDNLLVRRAGLMSPPRYLTRLGETLTALHATPGPQGADAGRRRRSPPGSSTTGRTRTRRTAPSRYYLKGEVVCLLLDLEIRRATRDAQEPRRRDAAALEALRRRRGVPEDGVEAAAAEVAGRDLQAFFDRALRSTDELDYSVLQHVGLEARFRVRESPNDKGGSRAAGEGGTSEAARAGWA